MSTNNELKQVNSGKLGGGFRHRTWYLKVKIGIETSLVTFHSSVYFHVTLLQHFVFFISGILN